MTVDDEQEGMSVSSSYWNPKLSCLAHSALYIIS